MVTGEGRGQKNNQERSRVRKEHYGAEMTAERSFCFPKLWCMHYLFISDPTLNLK